MLVEVQDLALMEVIVCVNELGTREREKQVLLSSCLAFIKFNVFVPFILILVGECCVRVFILFIYFLLLLF